MTQSQKSRQNIYETITSRLLAMIEADPGDPVMPWQRAGTCPVLPTNAVTGQGYRGVNILSLWVAALERGYNSGEWATLRQWNEKGAHVRKGEKASPIVFYKEISVGANSVPEEAEGETERRRLARGYWVFAAEQVECYQPVTALPPSPIDRIAAAESYFAAMGAKLVVGGTQACYRPSTDTIHMPDEARFLAADGRSRTEAWYAVLGHESTHYAASRIMPRRCALLQVYLDPPTRHVGIIRGLPGRRAACCRADSGRAAPRPVWFGPWPSPSAGCRRGCTSAWSRPIHGRARAR